MIDDYKISNETIKEPFNKTSRIDIYSQLKNRLSVSELYQLENRVTTLQEKVKTHYDKHRESWVNLEIERITKKRHRPSGNEYTPSGKFGSTMEKPTDPSVIRRVAESNVEFRQQKRVAQVNEIHNGMTRSTIEKSRS